MEHLRRLWLFTQVAEAGSFTQAALQAGVTVAAMSKNVAQLERSLGVRLFTRSTRAVQLTAEGRQLQQQALQAFAGLEGAMDKVSRARREIAGLVRISSVTSFGRHVLMPTLAGLFARYPGIELDISFHEGGHGASRRGEDIHITWGEDYHGDKVCKRLMTMPLVIVASPDYLAAHGTPTRPEALAAHHCIGSTLPNGVAARWILRPVGARRSTTPFVLQPRGRLLVRDELEAVVDAAVAGLGIVMVTEYNVAAHLRDGRLVRLLPDIEIEGHSAKFAEIVLQYPRRDEMSARVRAVVDYLLEALGGH